MNFDIVDPFAGSGGSAISFVSNVQDAAQTLRIELSALVKLSQPESGFHVLASHCLTLANTLSAEANDAADAIQFPPRLAGETLAPPDRAAADVSSRLR